MIIYFVAIGLNLVLFGMITCRKIRFVKVLFLALCEWIKEKWLARSEEINCIKEKWLALCEGINCIKEKWLALCEGINCIKEKWLARSEKINCIKEKWLALCERIKCIKEKWLTLCEKYDKRDTEEKKNRTPFFLTVKSFEVKNNSLLDPETILNLSFVLIVYISLFVLLFYYIMELRSSSGIISEKGAATASVFLFFAVIFDSIMSLILWIIKTMLDAARRCYGNRKNDYFTFIEVFLLFGLIEFNYNISDNISDILTLIFLAEIMILWFFVLFDQCCYIEKLTKSLIKDRYSYTKEEAISECLLIYTTNLIILSIMVFILVEFDHFLVGFDQSKTIIGLFKTERISKITLHTCLRFCALTFIGMGASEFDSESVSFSLITLVIRLIGLLTHGLIAGEILSHVVSENREK